MHREHFNRQLRGVGLTGSVVNIDDRRVRPGEREIYTLISIENETSGGNTARILSVLPFSEVLHRFFSTFAADTPQTYADAPIIVSVFGRLRLAFTGSTTGDVLVVYLHGFTEFIDVP